MAKVQKKVISTFLTALMILSLFAVICSSSTVANAAVGDTIYFEAPSDWSMVYCYAWEPKNASWPGETMNKVEGNIYSYTLSGAQSKIIFSNGNTQTEDLDFEGADKIFKITGDSNGKKTGSWSDYNQSNPTEPTVKATASSTTFTNTLTITLSAKNCTSATYSINDGAEKSYSDGDKITIGADVAVGSKVTVKLKGTNGTKTATATYTYTKKDTSSETVVAIKNSAKWSVCYVYAWSGANNEMTPWPGTKVTETDADGNYIFTIPEEYVGQVVIHNNADGKSKDLAITSGKSMIYDNSSSAWTEYQTGAVRFSSFTADAVSPQYTGSTIVFTAKATSTNGSVTYEFKVSNGSKTTTINSFSSKNSAAWTPTSAGTYTITVTAKDSKGETNSKKMSFVINSSSSATEPIILGTTPANGSALGTSGSKKTITLNTAGGKIGTNLIFVKPIIKDPNGKQLNTAYYSQKKSVSFTPTIDGEYTITFYAQNSYNTTINREFKFIVGENIDPDPIDDISITSFTASKTSAAVGDSITLKTTATGSNLKYKYMVQLDGTWTTIRSASTTSSYTWKPTKAGTYTVRVVVTDGKNESRKDITVKVTSGLTISSLTASKTSATVGDSITLKTTATGSNLKYKYMVCLNGTWTTVRSASTTSSYTWKPTKAGTYTVRVVVTDGKNEVRKEITVKVSAGVTISSLTASKTSAAVGDSITLKTTATGSNLKYKYMVQLDGTWTTVRSASTTSSYTWKPTKAGTYTVRVVVTDGKNEARKEVTVKVSAGVTISSLTASKTSAAVGDSITLKTTATGSNLKYKYMVCLNGTWTTVRSANTTSSYTWKPTKAGTYTVRVVVTDGKNEARKEVTVKVSAGVTISSLTASKTSAAVGDSITLKTTATGSNLKYKYMVCLNGTWTTVRSASTTSSYTWKPTKAGTYTVRVVVTDGKNEVRKEITVKVSAGVTISSLTASKTSATVGDSITLKTTATGSNLKYKYMVCLNGTWTTVRSASTTSSYTWKPTKAGTYTVRVVVTDGKNEARKEVTVKVSAGVTISSLTASKTSATVGDSITLKTTATGSSLKYKYMVCLNGTWTTVRSASTTSSYTWKPTKAGTYTVRVVVTDGKNEARKEVTVKVSAVSTVPTISSFTASSTVLSLGSSTTLKTTATGSNLNYKYMVQRNGGSWTTIKSSNTTSSYTWKPTQKGTYTVRVVVTDGKTEVRKDIAVIVQ